MKQFILSILLSITICVGAAGIGICLGSDTTRTQTFASDVRGGADQPDQTISTTVEDPNHPGEPWIITTYKRKDESFEAFVKRHKDMVDAVRKALS